MTDSKQQVIEQIKLWLVKYELGKATLDEAPKAIYAIAQRHFQPSNPPSAIELTEMLFEQYAMVDDDTLSKGAQKLKNRLLGMARRAMQKDDRQPITSATESSVSNETDNKPDAAAGGDIDLLCDPRRWTEEMQVAWHKTLPDVEAAFRALKAALPRHKDTSAGDVDAKALEEVLTLKLDDYGNERGWQKMRSYEMADIAAKHYAPYLHAHHPEPARAGQDAGAALLDPDMPSQELRLHCGEMTAGEERTGRACIRWANSVRAEHPSVTVADLQPIREALMTARDNAQFVLDKCDHKYIPTIAIKDIRSAADMALAALEARAAKDGGA